MTGLWKGHWMFACYNNGSTQLCTISICLNPMKASFDTFATLRHLHESIRTKGWKLSLGFDESFFSMKRVGGSTNLHSQSVQQIGRVPEYCTSTRNMTHCRNLGWFSLRAPYEKQKKWATDICILFWTEYWLHICFQQLWNHWWAAEHAYNERVLCLNWPVSQIQGWFR